VVLALTGCAPPIPEERELIGEWTSAEHGGALILNEGGLCHVVDIPDNVLLGQSFDPPSTGSYSGECTWPIGDAFGNVRSKGGWYPFLDVEFVLPAVGAPSSGMFIVVNGSGDGRELRVDLGDPDLLERYTLTRQASSGKAGQGSGRL
jgi:hypothetical protein